jgi:hypothetical protein
VRILIVAAGSRGDVAPYTGLGARLRQAGHQVTISAHAPHRALVEDAGLLLVSNAVRHAGTPIEVVVARTGRYVHLAVRDYVSRPARLLGSAGEDVPGGRGLLIVDAFTSCWGCTPTRDGKVTWATLPIR